MEAYKVAKKALQSSLRNAEITYFSNQLEMNKKDIGKTWKVINVILGLGRNKYRKQVSFLIDNEYVTDSLQIAQKWSKNLLGKLLMKVREELL